MSSSLPPQSHPPPPPPQPQLLLPVWSRECQRGWFLQWRNAITLEKLGRPKECTISEYVELSHSAILKECLHESKTTDRGVQLYLERTNINSQVPEQPRWLYESRKKCQEECKTSENFTVCLAERFYDVLYNGRSHFHLK
jgi:hypothetical protein